MKHLTKTFLILLLLSLSAGSCKKDDDDNPNNNSDNFSEFFYCKINGEEFRPQGSFTCNNQVFYYYHEETAGISAGYLLIRGRDCPTGRNVRIRISGLSPETGFLDFSAPAFADSCFPGYVHFVNEQNEIHMEHLLAGSATITTFTPRDSVSLEYGRIEGTFEFSVTNENQDSIIHITEGAFRFKVPNMW